MHKFAARDITEGALTDRVTRMENSTYSFYKGMYNSEYIVDNYYKDDYVDTYTYSAGYTYRYIKADDVILLGLARDMLDAKLKGLIK